jgi:L-lactate dehydrogenase complex protein LldE
MSAVQFFIPCFVNQFYPGVGINMHRIFQKIGVEVVYNPQQACCGQMAFNSGDWPEARKLALKFMNDFQTDTPIVSPSASCSSYLKNYFHKLFEPGTAAHERYQTLTPNIYELSDFLVNQLQITNLGATFPYKVTFHDSCSALREYRLKDEARMLLSKVKGLELIEMNERDECCGFGGTFAVKHKHISQAMVQQKTDRALETGAEYITSTETSCLLNIEGYIKKQQLPIKAVHFSEILVSGW